jgi:glutamate--cysteine ligase
VLSKKQGKFTLKEILNFMEENTLINSKEDLIRDLMRGCKPVEEFKIGVEHEKFIFEEKTLSRLPYKRGIEEILKKLQDCGWQGIYEQDNLIALEKGLAFVSLEPAGQLELSGSPLSSLHDTAYELHQHLKELKEILKSSGSIAVGLGYDPLSNLHALSWVPKERYQIMRSYMPRKERYGLEMMANTCTVQVNLDFCSEKDMVRKFRVGLALQPVATALFAHSSLKGGEPNGFQSFRKFIWEHTDPDRCGLLDFVFEEEMGFERYVDYMLDVPMYFVYREGRYLNAAGQSFKDFLKGSLPAYPRHFPFLKDWHDHLTVAFPEVRLKHYLEMRGADSGLEDHINALPAFWTGLLYDERALDLATALIEEWSLEELKNLYSKVAREGLNATIQGKSLREIAHICLAWAKDGLQRRAITNCHHEDESIYLLYLEEIVASGKNPARKLLEDFNFFKGDMKEVFKKRTF